MAERDPVAVLRFYTKGEDDYRATHTDNTLCTRRVRWEGGGQTCVIFTSLGDRC